ncbi:dTMP kinase [Terrihabitans sp. B22-R8]|uniref:dTMP kinase n=1 Tax=Terrihabitans sp. B22-R8 TaxID=3425128 RepID=UPI00403CD579
MRERFITLEGGEGTGKSTQAKKLADRLQALGWKVTTTREPGGSPDAERLRELILSGDAKEFGAFAEAMLFSAARIDHLRQTINPALRRKEWVVCDRFLDSTRAYQGALGNLDPGILRAVEHVVVDTRPGLTFLLDLPAEIGLERAQKRSTAPRDRFESETLDYHRSLRQAFLDIAAAEPERIVVIDAEPDQGAVAEAVWKATTQFYGLREPSYG